MKILPAGADLFYVDRRTDRCDEANSRVWQFSKRAFKVQQTNFNIFSIRGEIFFLRKLKWNEKKMEAEHCWAITQAEGWSYCGRSGSSVLEFGFQMESLVHTYWSHVYSVPTTGKLDEHPTFQNATAALSHSLSVCDSFCIKTLSVSQTIQRRL
jgi:hypothetical protein